MHFLTAVISGIGCLLFFRLYSDAIKQPEFFAGGPYRWYVAAVGAYFYCQLAVNFVVFVTFVDTRCKHHNILVVNRVDLCGNQIYGAFVLNRRVDLHAIDATPARWRGDVGSSPLDGASAATSSPRNDLVKNYRVHPTHWLISTQVTARLKSSSAPGAPSSAAGGPVFRTGSRARSEGSTRP